MIKSIFRPIGADARGRRKPINIPRLTARLFVQNGQELEKYFEIDQDYLRRAVANQLTVPQQPVNGGSI